MSKPATLSEPAYAALMAHKREKNDSLSQIILRFVPPPIRTFEDLEKHLQNLDGPVVDMEVLRELRIRKRKANGAD
jgi:predicted CopG family antitoxin